MGQLSTDCTQSLAALVSLPYLLSPLTLPHPHQPFEFIPTKGLCTAVPSAFLPRCHRAPLRSGTAGHTKTVAALLGGPGSTTVSIAWKVGDCRWGLVVQGGSGQSQMNERNGKR